MGGEGIKILVGGESIRGGIFPGQWGEEISKRLAGGREPSRENPCQYASFMYRISLCENANSTCGEIQTPQWVLNYHVIRIMCNWIDNNKLHEL